MDSMSVLKLSVVNASEYRLAEKDNRFRVTLQKLNFRSLSRGSQMTRRNSGMDMRQYSRACSCNCTDWGTAVPVHQSILKYAVENDVSKQTSPGI
eukprot:CAMPEP_0168802488 /NCGR_PEP_ID=MMETSP0725-20121227/20095_1 /TAXON_ID=265536 /ORGANISM="Amphiprora sp., Strain CCMP467" /LENGTH=94 /DNA_ID=CAMNT_0008854233 /DNA_START=143 /DNA_END=427 /DNA_ORIENTATION=+